MQQPVSSTTANAVRMQEKSQDPKFRIRRNGRQKVRRRWPEKTKEEKLQKNLAHSIFLKTLLKLRARTVVGLRGNQEVVTQASIWVTEWSVADWVYID